MHAQPLISVLMPSYNCAPYISAAITAILGQSLADIELIVVDDASTDATLPLVRARAEMDGRLTLLAQSNRQGPAAARNAALSAAKGDWIAVVDADDLIHPRRFERLLAQASELEADIVADDLVYFGGSQTGTLLQARGLTEPWFPTLHEFLEAETCRPALPVGYLKPLMRRSAIGTARYREDMTVGEDFDFLFRVLMGRARLAILPEAYYLYRRHSGSTSHRLSVADADGMLRANADLRSVVPPDLVVPLMARRQRHLLDRRFAHLVGLIKAGQHRQAAWHACRHPALLRRLAQAANERVRSRSADPAHPAPSQIALLSEAEGFDAATGFRPLRVPAQSGAWQASRAAEIASATAAGTSRLQVHGRAGLEALGYVPGWEEAELLPPENGWTSQEMKRISGLAWPVRLCGQS